jgi:RecJ-like exonuclease
MEYTTEDMTFALSALGEGLEVYVCHPEDEDDRLFTVEQIQDCDGHLFLIKKERRGSSTMGAMKDMLIDMCETPFKDRCPECDGEGEIEFDAPRAHAGGYNDGCIDTEWDTCERCDGEGEVERLCEECGEPVCKARTKDSGLMVINPDDFNLCEDCAV